MSKEKEKKSIGITVKKDDDMAEWYGQIVQKSELADYAPVRGCMIIRPRGYALWQAIQDQFNKQIQAIGVQNAYFPLFIPESFFKKEQEHAAGFKPEVAWIEKEDMGERLAVRPTSETIMYDAYSNWIRSHRDLPLRINQWCNVVRWEVSQTKIFLRTREFLWQEGHCVYATEQECVEETEVYLKEYQKLIEGFLAIPLILGTKTPSETFPGAKYTLTIESFMPDGKALQCGTSHNLGQGFGKSFGIRFIGEDEKEHIPWQNSWGISTRLLGALIMMHGDDKGLVIPPKIAKDKVVIVPILFDATREKVLAEANKLKEELQEFGAFLDDREEYKPGWKFNEWELKGVPLRVELGPKDLDNGTVMLSRRDTGEKTAVKISDIKATIKKTIEQMQSDMFKKAQTFLKERIVEVNDWETFVKVTKNGQIASVAFCLEKSCEAQIKEKTSGVTSRCTPLGEKPPKGDCIHCGGKAKATVLFSRSY